jgi:hypothetical protein
MNLTPEGTDVACAIVAREATLVDGDRDGLRIAATDTVDRVVDRVAAGEQCDGLGGAALLECRALWGTVSFLHAVSFAAAGSRIGR